MAATPGLHTRLVPAIRRRVNLALVRLRYPRVSFGRRCDVRLPLHITVRPGGSVRIGDGCVLDRGLVIEASGPLVVGARTIFGHHCTVAAHEDVSIGDDCLIADMVGIRDHDHAWARTDIPIRDQGETTAPVRIAAGVWIGSKATITQGVTVAEGAIIGAGAVVTRDVPAMAIAVGVPARVVRERGSPSAST